MIVDYTYGTGDRVIDNGMPTTIVDGLTGIEQDILYEDATGGGLGQVERVTETDGSTSYYTEYTYDDAGSRSTALYHTPSSATDTKWKYADYIWVGAPDSGGRVFQRMNKMSWNGTAWVESSEEFHYQYDASGRLSSATFGMSPIPTSMDAGAPTSAPYYTSTYPALYRGRAWYDYDPAGRLQSIEHYWDVAEDTYPPSSTYTYGTNVPLKRTDYPYEITTGTANDNRGLRTSATFYSKTSSANTWTANRTEYYTYDDERDFLKEADYNDGQANENPQWTYDASGNRISDSTNVGTWTYDGLNRMTASPGITYTNDILGNRSTQTGSKTYTWDAINRMTSYGNGTDTWNYRYRADGMRSTKKKSTGGLEDTSYRYDGQMLMEEYFAGSQYPRDYLQVIRYGLGARGIDYIQRVQSLGTTVTGFPIYDGHGNMTACLFRNSSSPYYTLANERSYDAWGKIRTGNTGGEPNPRYVANLGHVQDDENGLIYMRARYYEPGTGRFINEDPAMDGSNWFIYCDNNPINLIDATGKEFSPICDNFIESWMRWLGIEKLAQVPAAVVKIAKARETIMWCMGLASYGEALFITGTTGPTFINPYTAGLKGLCTFTGVFLYGLGKITIFLTLATLAYDLYLIAIDEY